MLYFSRHYFLIKSLHTKHKRKSRTLFVRLIEKFVNGIISGKEFSDSFLELRQKLIYECDGFLKELGSEKLKDFQLDPRSYGFGSLISFLRAECDNFSENYQNEAMILSKTVF